MTSFPSNKLLISRTFDSFEELATIVRAWDTDFRQIRRSEDGHRLLQVLIDGLLMSRAQFGCHVDQHGTTPAGFRTFALLEESCPPTYWFGRNVGPNDLLIFPEHGEIEAISRPGFCNHTVAIPMHELANFFERSGGPDLGHVLGPEDTVVTPPPDLLRRLRAHLRKISFDESVLSRSLALFDAYRDKLFALLLEILRDKAEPGLLPLHHSQARRIRDVARLVDARREEPPCIADLCAIAKVPERTLNEIFRRDVGMSPGAFVKGSRLYGTHRDLWRAYPSRVRIADVANAWGFWHMGQFAADYRKLFGEMPRATLKRLPAAG
jgi:AraC family ethanolamine operon transcriptional activator